MTSTGLFVSVDGPGGAGKSTTVDLAGSRLTGLGYRVCLTAEPSVTPVGQMIRAGTDTYRGMALACLVAGDRHHHLETQIRPERNAGAVVITDRCLPSSLVLQRMDGLSWQTIWHHHAGIEPPDLAVIVSASPQVLAARLASRGQARSRFERQPGSSATEHALYRDTAARLTGMGWEICEIDSTTSTPDQIAAIVTDRVLALLADRERSC